MCPVEIPVPGASHEHLPIVQNISRTLFRCSWMLLSDRFNISATMEVSRIASSSSRVPEPVAGCQTSIRALMDEFLALV